jgi:predicted amidophosphoribosyltransferase
MNRMSCCGPRQCNNFDEDRESVSEDDIARFGGDGIACPACGAGVYHDAPLCARCGHAMTDDSLRRRTPAWVPLLAAGAILGILLVYALRVI